MTTEFVPLSSIIISEDRQRRFFDLAKLIELADDIKQHGLLHAPILQSNSLTLLAGERRLRAIEILHDTEAQFMYAGEVVPHGMVPVTRAHHRNPLGWMAAELSENIARMDLTWQERSAAVATLQRLRQAQNPTWTKGDTLEELRARTPGGYGAAVLQEELIVAEHLEDPEIQKAKSRKEALKIVERKHAQAKARKLAEQFDLRAKGSCPHRPIQGNSLEILSELDGEQFDLLLTDPPYGVDAQDFGSMNLLGHAYDDSSETWLPMMRVLAAESWRLCKPNSHAYVFCDINQWAALRDTFETEGWQCWPRPMIWAKGNGMLPKPDYGPRYTYEALLFATKGTRKVTSVGLPDVISIPMLSTNRVHGAEKPAALYLELIRRSCLPGSTILDPFMGSGPVFPAANLAKCIATGIELNPTYFGLAISRLEGTQ